MKITIKFDETNYESARCAGILLGKVAAVLNPDPEPQSPEKPDVEPAPMPMVDGTGSSPHPNY